MNNPLQILNMLKKSKNPKEAVTNMISQNGNPILKNLVDMANKGDTKGVEEFARNLYKQQGKDFDKEFSQFKENFK
jgi:hypothetical protein